jgi:hypothetical protein
MRKSWIRAFLSGADRGIVERNRPIRWMLCLLRKGWLDLGCIVSSQY